MPEGNSMSFERFTSMVSRLLVRAALGLRAISLVLLFIGTCRGTTVSAKSSQVAALEPERISPQNTLSLPPISTKSGYSTFLSYNYLAQGRPCMPVVVIDVPKAFAPRSPAGPIKAWQVLLLVRFNHESSTIEAGTPELFGCVGHCNGRMTLMIGNGLGDKWSLAERAFRAEIANYDRLEKDDGFATNEAFDPPLGYKRGIYVKKNPRADQEYYSDADNADEVNYVLRCDPHLPVPNCWAYFSIPKYQWINVTLTFDMLDLPIWRTIRESASGLVESMVRDIVSPTSCKSE
jgi:hypothetical protein